MRPLLSVVLMPSTPMNEDRLCTAGSCENHLRQLLLALRHRGERDRLRRFGDAEDHAGVLHREEALRHDDVQAGSSPTSVATATSSVAVWCRSTQRSVVP